MKKLQKILLWVSLILTLKISLNPEVVNAQTSDAEESSWQQFQHQVEQVIEDGTNLVDSLQQDINTLIQSVTIPNFEQMIAEILGLSVEDQQLSQIIENKPLGSYGLQEDAQEQANVNVANQTIYDSTLSPEAQQNLQNTSETVAYNVQTTQHLAEESQQLDVTQQILQNLAQQEALNAERQGLMIQQNQQAQIDQAINNLLTAQQTEKLNQTATAKRRENLAAGMAATAQYGLIRMPGLPPSQDSLEPSF